jgi:hypothetical protein
MKGTYSDVYVSERRVIELEASDYHRGARAEASFQVRSPKLCVTPKRRVREVSEAAEDGIPESGPAPTDNVGEMRLGPEGRPLEVGLLPEFPAHWTRASANKLRSKRTAPLSRSRRSPSGPNGPRVRRSLPLLVETRVVGRSRSPLPPSGPSLVVRWNWSGAGAVGRLAIAMRDERHVTAKDRPKGRAIATRHEEQPARSRGRLLVPGETSSGAATRRRGVAAEVGVRAVAACCRSCRYFSSEGSPKLANRRVDANATIALTRSPSKESTSIDLPT